MHSFLHVSTQLQVNEDETLFLESPPRSPVGEWPDKIEDPPVEFSVDELEKVNVTDGDKITTLNFGSEFPVIHINKT